MMFREIENMIDATGFEPMIDATGLKPMIDDSSHIQIWTVHEHE